MSQTQPIYQTIAILQDARLRCIETKNLEFRAIHAANIAQIVKDFMPSGTLHTVCLILRR